MNHRLTIYIFNERRITTHKEDKCSVGAVDTLWSQNGDDLRELLVQVALTDRARRHAIGLSARLALADQGTKLCCLVLHAVFPVEISPLATMSLSP